MLNRAAVRGRYTLIPDRESVVVTITRGKEKQSIPVSDAWRKPATFADFQAAGLSVVSLAETWHIPDAVFNPEYEGREIHREDIITTADRPPVEFVVLSATLKTLRTDWVCICQRRKL